MNYWDSILPLRTAINAGWTALSFLILIIFLRHLFSQKSGIFSSKKLSLSNEIALAVSVYFLGTLIFRGWAVVYLISEGRGFAELVQSKYPLSIVGSVLAFISGLWLIKIFSPEKWRPFGWIFCAIASLVFSGFMAYTNSN